mmetsp:Transcript_14967/g.41404  ORF Transcript_14967/g.41404 Transcript_14967/m.41404 type:complete len:297 (-) Transcript_14967:137-1027(-)|eukprot:CAMPEP_0179055472 /NCGR_PEP_ID=MMETSP0796-20121207/23320_1 /TAXON_ID=73915 /ORGANISM="Pyrodinium bahamense, Strain pbaha01" /LENGTH=296 /DNA_ID=CAMNT_0020752129 /DNA_START=87 /DNA_END=977 /DNA_ORIENTATION=+
MTATTVTVDGGGSASTLCATPSTLRHEGSALPEVASEEIQDRCYNVDPDRAMIKARLESALEDGSLERLVMGDSVKAMPPPQPQEAWLPPHAPEATAADEVQRALRKPRPTMLFEDPTKLGIDPELRTLVDNVISLPLEGPVGELATHLKREILNQKEDGRSSVGMSDWQEPRHSREDSTVISVSTDAQWACWGRRLGSEAPSLKERPAANGKSEEGLVQPRVPGGWAPDFAKYARLTPVILDTHLARLNSLSKDEIRSENERLRTEIESLRSEIRQRHAELVLVECGMPDAATST